MPEQFMHMFYPGQRTRDSRKMTSTITRMVMIRLMIKDTRSDGEVTLRSRPPRNRTLINC